MVSAIERFHFITVIPKFLSIERQRRDRTIQPFYRIGCTQEIRLLIFNLRKCLCIFISYVKFGLLKYLRLKQRRGDEETK